MLLVLLIMPQQLLSKCIVGGMNLFVVTADAGPVNLYFDRHGCNMSPDESTNFGEVLLGTNDSIRVIMEGSPDSDCIVMWWVEHNGLVIREGNASAISTVLDGIHAEGSYRVWQGPMGSVVEAHPVHSFQIIHIQEPLDRIQVNIRVFLDGAMDLAYSGFPRMTNTIVRNNLLPSESPYTGPDHIPATEIESIVQDSLRTDPHTPWVDWVFVEIRDAGDPSTIIASKSALLRRCGAVSDIDMQGPPSFELPRGYYHVSVRHRNHLGVCTANPVFLSSPSPTVVAFNHSSTGVHGSETRSCPTQYSCRLRAGNVFPDGMLKYVGTNNDRDLILQRIGGIVPTAIVSGYYPEDVNLDGTVKYAGAQNDRDIILQSIGGSVPSNVVIEQLP